MTITYTTKNRVATITLNRPNVRNALDDPTLIALAKAFEKAKNDESLIAVVLKGEGKDFCAGADFKTFVENGQLSKEENKQNALVFSKLLFEMKHLNKPLIGIIHGSVFGGGIGLVACCDIVYAAATTKFCFSEVKIGLVPALIGPYAIEAMGERFAKRYMLTGEVFSAQIAQQLGLVHEVYLKKNLSKELNALLKTLKTNAPKATHKIKKMLILLKEQHTPKQVQDYTAEIMANVRACSEAQEGLKAFLEKRKPKWKI